MTLQQKGNSYHITSKRPFNGIKLRNEHIRSVFEFAYGMTFGQQGHHRDHRTGGKTNRKNGEKFANTFQGKLAEFAFYQFLTSNQIQATLPDLEQWGQGEWDDVDMTINDFKISIKSAASFSHLLLLEENDWDANGNYIPNLQRNPKEPAHYDIHVLVRLTPDLKREMKAKKLFYSNEATKKQTIEVINHKWKFDIAGYITNNELVTIIDNRQILPQNSMLNGTTPMDANNYYVQAGCMHHNAELLHLLYSF